MKLKRICSLQLNDLYIFLIMKLKNKILESEPGQS